MTAGTTATGIELLTAGLRSATGRDTTTLPLADRAQTLLASPAQQAIWSLDRLRPGASEYLVPLLVRLTGDIDGPQVNHVIRRLVARHEILRTRYRIGSSGILEQIIDAEPRVVVPVENLSGCSALQVEHRLAEVLAEETDRSVDLATGPVLRARLLQVDATESLLLLMIHHIAIDGWSGPLLMRELGELFAGGEPRQLHRQYADFAQWQRRTLTDSRLTDGVAWWASTLQDLSRLELPTDRPRPPRWHSVGDSVALELGPDEVGRIRDLAARTGATPFMVYTAALWSTLGRFSGQRDFAIGTPTSGRLHPETEDQIGAFVNMVPLRADLSGDPGLGDLVERARRTAVDAYAHQEVPFDAVVGAVNPGWDPAAHPVFPVSLALQDFGPLAFEAPRVRGEALSVPITHAKYDLEFQLTAIDEGGLRVTVGFPTALFDPATVESITEDFVAVLRFGPDRPNDPTGTLVPQNPAETRSIEPGSVAGDTGTDPAAGNIVAKFRAQAVRYADRTAVSFGTDSVDYATLDRRSDRLAVRLRRDGVGTEDLVAICLDRGIDLVVALLAVMKCGAAYLPVDPDTPVGRLAHIIDDARPRLAVVDSRGPQRVDLPLSTSTVDLATEDSAPAADPRDLEDLRNIRIDPRQCAYVIYTSGSTGRPKGVEVEHCNVLRLFAATAVDFRFSEQDVWSMVHSQAFDFSVWEIWGALLHGARLVLLSREQARSPWDVADVLAEEKVTILSQTPLAFRGLGTVIADGDVDPGSLALRAVVLGGDAVERNDLDRWWSAMPVGKPRIVNMYGITETTVHVTLHEVTPHQSTRSLVSFGDAFAGVRTRLLDEHGRGVPVGAVGEIHVAGSGVARGYRGRPALTAQRFVPDPWGQPGSRMYRSGDLASRDADGNGMFRGRADDQVKIRGHRIELGDVLGAVTSISGVSAAVVGVLPGGSGERQVVAHVVAEDSELDGIRIRHQLRDRLPEYMIPSAVVMVDSLPINANGKVDRTRLPAPAPRTEDTDTADGTPLECEIAETWQRVLGVTSVDPQDNFFDLGGDSIRAVQVVGDLRTRGISCTVQELFRHQTVAGLASVAGTDPAPASAVPDPFSLLTVADRRALPPGLVDAYPLLNLQAGMAFEQMRDRDRLPYHNTTTYLVTDDAAFDPEALQQAWSLMIRRHEVLRTSLQVTGWRRPLQFVHRFAGADIGYDDLRSVDPQDHHDVLAAFRQRERDRPFDLRKPPLARIHVHRIDTDRWHLTFTECHAVLDGWSHHSLLIELLTAYRAVRDGAVPPTVDTGGQRFVTMVAAEQRALESAEDNRFWADHLADAEAIGIPDAWRGAAGPDEYVLTVPYADLEARLREVAAAIGVPLKSVLHTAHLAAWSVTTGVDNGLSGLVCNGRPEVAGGDRVHGLFLNTVPFRAPALDQQWRNIIAAVFEQEVALWPHRRFPLAEMLRRWGTGAANLQVAFNYLDFHVMDQGPVDDAATVDVSPTEFPAATIAERGALHLVARSAMVARPFGEIVARSMRTALEAIADDPETIAAGAVLADRDRRALRSIGRGGWADRRQIGLAEQVLRAAAGHPDATAVTVAGRSVDYRDLRERVKRIQDRLLAAAVAPSDVVALCLQRDPDYVAALLAVVSVGAAYQPIDPTQPPARIVELISRSRAAAALVAGDTAPAVPDGCRLVNLAGEWQPATSSSAADPTSRRPDPQEIAAVIGTSGSTGNPKSVLVTNRGLTDRVETMRRWMRLGSTDVVVSVVPQITDVSQLCVFSALTVGARLVLATDSERRDPEQLSRLMTETGCTFLQATPTTWRMLLDSGWRPPAGFRMISGGERIDSDLLDRMLDVCDVVWDFYGPTEATVFCSATIRRRGIPPTTLVAPNTHLLVLDRSGDPVVDGVSGEIHVGGSDLAAGYLSDGRNTAGAFLPDPTDPGGRLYATGDVGRWVGGELQILGRNDDQVKIRGLRVELGEIEAVLRGRDGVLDAAVTTHRTEGDHVITAHLQVVDGTDPSAVVREVANLLPAHMIPARARLIAAIPTLPNGKVDRRALSAADDGVVVEQSLGDPDPPRTELEQRIAAVWESHLGVRRVGRVDEFFAIGGHSLQMVSMIAELERELGSRIGFRDFLENSTVAGLAQAVERGSGSDDLAAAPVLRTLRGPDPEVGPAEVRQLYCVHPQGGSGHWYQELARAAAPRIAVQAFEWPGLLDGRDLVDQPHQALERYAEAVNTDEVSGPAVLLGWSAASRIAWPLAKLLTARIPVRLILIDPAPATAAEPEHLARLDRAAELIDHLLRAAEPVQDPGFDELSDTLALLADESESVAPLRVEDLSDLWRPRVRSWQQIAAIGATERYPRLPVDVDLVLTRSLLDGGHQNISGTDVDAYIDSWRQRTGGAFSVHHAPGGHFSALQPPRARVLSGTVSRIVLAAHDARDARSGEL